MNIKGQSSIEYLLILPLMLGLWVAIVWFARVIIIEIELLNTARYGVLWLVYSSNNAITYKEEKQYIKAECFNFLKRQDPALNSKQITIDIDTGNKWKSSSHWKQLLKDPLKIFQIVEKLSDLKFLKSWVGFVEPKPASITITYALAAPPLLNRIPGFPPSIPLRGFCVCYR